MTDRLSAFGYSFQVKVITSLLTSKTFLQRISDILEPKYFESEANQWIVNTILEYQKEYRDSPSLDVLKVQLDNEDNDVLKESVVSHLRDAWKYTDSNDLEYIKDKALDFCKNQEIKKAILKSVEMLKDGNYDGIKVAVDDAMKAGADEEIGHDYLSSMEERYSESVRYPLETPWEVINDLTSGGLGKGELGVMVAPAGIGKCVGPNTLIDIEYEQIGIEVSSKLDPNKKVVLWIDPWEQFEVDEGIVLYAYQVERLISLASDSGKST